MQWTTREFNFDFSADEYPQIIDRLRNTPSRIEQLTSTTAPSNLIVQSDGKWSIQEHIGHLLDLEPLFTGRLDDFEASVVVLRPADMTNAKTYDADHNKGDISVIMDTFKTVRGEMIQRLDEYAPEMFAKTARHPRLNTPMRLVDSLYFQAEHDEHHIGIIIGIMGQV